MGMAQERTASSTHSTACDQGSSPDEASHRLAPATAACTATVPASSL